MVRDWNHMFGCFLLTLSVSINVSLVSCVALGNLAQQNFQDNFKRAFTSQLDLIENQNVGCLYDRDVCALDDKCLDDELFGTCIAAYAKEVTFAYRLPPQLLQDLKAILATLVAQNYTWHDRYTQCCVRAALICASMEIPLDTSVCRDFTLPRGLDEYTKPIEESRSLEDTSEDSLKDLTKRLEFLNRKKYDYYIDIPEKKQFAAAAQDLTEAQYAEERRAQAWNEIERMLDWDSNSGRDNLNDRPSETEVPVAQPERQELSARVDNSDSAGENYIGDVGENEADGHGDDNDEGNGSAFPMQQSTWRFFERQEPPTSKEQSKDLLLPPPPPPPPPASSVESFAVKLRKRQADSGFVDGSYLWVQFGSLDRIDVPEFIQRLNQVAGRQLLGDEFSVNRTNNEVYFQLAPSASPGDVKQMFENQTLASELKEGDRFAWTSYGFGRPQNRVAAAELGDDQSQRTRLTSTLLVCALVLGMIAALLVVFVVQRFRSSKQKLRDLTTASGGSGNADYRDLCRQRMLEKSGEQHEPVSAAAQQIASARPAASDSPNSSTGSWSDDPITTDMDITTGHLILSYMEEYLSNKEKLEQEWATLCTYEADQSSSAVGAKAENADKNRYPDLLPYDHTRVILRTEQNGKGADYINASYIADSDPKVKSHILAQGPTESTAGDFWQMLWECGSVTIVNLTKLRAAEEPGVQELCSQYWPGEGSKLFDRFEVHLVSEHIWCDAFVVRNFYLKNLATGEARTVTMFHFLAWDEGGLPPSAKALLDFRRKVNKSYKGRTSPLVIHCNDGCGRSGTYCLLDLALNRINKGVKEIDLAASLEHLRDQRPGLVKTKDQFEFVVTAIAEEVHNVLKTLPQ